MDYENDVKKTNDTETEKEQETIYWAKRYWRELTIAGLSAGMIVLLILLIRDRRIIKGLQAALDKATHDPAKIMEAKKIIDDLSKNSKNVTHASHLVSQHIRNLPEGFHPSSEKVIEAARRGIKLKPGQTWVVEYFTRNAA